MEVGKFEQLTLTARVGHGQLPEGILVAAIEVENAVEIAGRADVHGIGQSAYRGAWIVVGAVEESRHDVVGVGGGDESAR